MSPLKLAAHHRIFYRIIKKVGYSVLPRLEGIVGLAVAVIDIQAWLQRIGLT